MERLKALGRGTQIMFIASVLLLIISFFNWQEVDFDLGPLGEGSAGVSAWDNFLGILMGILTIVLVARIIARMAAVDVPIPVSFAMTSVVLGVIIAICAILKNLTDDYSTFWSYIGVGLAIVVAVGAWLEVQDAGGMDSLKSEASSLSSSVGAGSAPAAAAGTPRLPGAEPRTRPPTRLRQQARKRRTWPPGPQPQRQRLPRVQQTRRRTWHRARPTRRRTRPTRSRTQRATSRRPSGRRYRSHSDAAAHSAAASACSKNRCSFTHSA